ncbi:MAG: type II toxin-antitoxin system prevent-host-death family antitoxin [Alteraurantiacibacter sp.]
MTIVNMHEAKSNLSKLVAAINSGREKEVLIAVNGKPAARLVPIEPRGKLVWGALAGKIVVPDDIDSANSEIAQMFSGGSD